MKKFNIVFFVSYPEKFIENCIRQLKYYSDKLKESGILDDDRCENMYIIYTYEKNNPVDLINELYNHDKVVLENFNVSITGLKYDDPELKFPVNSTFCTQERCVCIADVQVPKGR